MLVLPEKPFRICSYLNIYKPLRGIQNQLRGKFAIIAFFFNKRPQIQTQCCKKHGEELSLLKYMSKTFDTKKFAADKIAFLGLLIVALLIARLIITSRSAIVLSEPIVLEHSGLSVSIPTGRGWRSENRWLYQEDGFTLSGVFVPYSANPTILVQCQYLLAAEDASASAMFEQRAQKIKGAIEKTGQTDTGSLTLDWAHIRRQKTLFNTFIGTVLLANNRRLNVKVDEVAGDTEAAERLFNKIIESLSFEGNPLLTAGTEIVTAIKDVGLDRFLHNREQQNFFLIKDTARRTIGFTMDVLIDSQQNSPLNIQGAGLLYLPGRYALEQATFFQSDNGFDEFEWQIERVERKSRTGTKISAEYSGPITVKRFGPQAEEKSYHAGRAMIPAVLADMVFEQMLDSDYEKIIIDVIKTDGAVAPMLVSRTEATDRAGDVDNIEYVLMAEFLDGRGFSEMIFFDSQRQILGSILKQEQVYIFERTDLETVLKLFPQQADYILKKRKTLKPN